MRLVISAALLMLAAGAGACRSDSGLPFYADRTFTPAWSPVDHAVTTAPAGSERFTDQAGRAFTPSDMQGTVHVVSFMFTRCSSICPPLITSLRRVQAATAGSGAVLLSYSVTPDIDPPAVLAQFGRDKGVDPARWKLLSGSVAGVRRVAHDLYFADDEGMRKSLENPDAFLHTEKLLLVDRQGRIRGVYNGTQAFEIDKLLADLRVLTD
jgi:protein SCO1/2